LLTLSDLLNPAAVFKRPVADCEKGYCRKHCKSAEDAQGVLAEEEIFLQVLC